MKKLRLREIIICPRSLATLTWSQLDGNSILPDHRAPASASHHQRGPEHSHRDRVGEAQLSGSSLEKAHCPSLPPTATPGPGGSDQTGGGKFERRMLVGFTWCHSGLSPHQKPEALSHSDDAGSFPNPNSCYVTDYAA